MMCRFQKCNFYQNRSMAFFKNCTFVSNAIFFSLATWLSHLFTRRQAFSSPTEYTFSHCESAPSQLNAAWGNSFRQLHSNFDNLLALRQISLEQDPVCSYSTGANGFRQGHSISAWTFNSLNSVTSVNKVHCVDFQCPLPYRGALCRYEATFAGVVSQLTTPMQSADLR